MNRCEVLRALLKGEKFEPNGPSDTAWLNWAQNHIPLVSPSTYTSTGRYLNHFCVGSDPEFTFNDIDQEMRIEAIQVGMKVGLAAGCDQNERLVELRPWPSRSVVAHVAGILTALRWMHRVYGRVIKNYNWRAGAYFAGDGMGGHVHFGRKRPTRKEEVAALDGLARVFKATGMFPVREWEARIRGDKRGQHYGLPGDMRVQKHGYEYRSLPSWLQSPTVAFIVLTCSKLAVLDPSITTTWNERDWEPTAAANALRGLAKLYRGRDDDAYILYHLLTRIGNNVFTVDHGAHFAPAWGIQRTDRAVIEESQYILPACIEPNSYEIKEIEDHLLRGTGLIFTKYPPNFTTNIPEKYTWLPLQIVPGRYAGYGDFIHDLVTHPSMHIIWEYARDDSFKIAGYLPLLWNKSETQLLQDEYQCRICPTGKGGHETVITVPKSLCQALTIGAFKDVLTKSGLFPIWTVETVKPDSIVRWLEGRPAPRTFETWRNV